MAEVVWRGVTGCLRPPVGQSRPTLADRSGRHTGTAPLYPGTRERRCHLSRHWSRETAGAGETRSHPFPTRVGVFLFGELRIVPCHDALPSLWKRRQEILLLDPMAGKGRSNPVAQVAELGVLGN